MAEAKNKNTNKELKERLSYVQGRISTLVDEIYALKNEFSSFRKAVAKDMQVLVERTNKK